MTKIIFNLNTQIWEELQLAIKEATERNEDYALTLLKAVEHNFNSKRTKTGKISGSKEMLTNSDLDTICCYLTRYGYEFVYIKGNVLDSGWIKKQI